MDNVLIPGISSNDNNIPDGVYNVDYSSNNVSKYFTEDDEEMLQGLIYESGEYKDPLSSTKLRILNHSCDFARCWECSKVCPYKDYQQGNWRFD